MIVKRDLNLKELLSKKSHFLFGPRGTGKTSLVTHTLPGDFPIIDLLSDDTFSRLIRRPSSLEEIIPIQSKTVVIDEIQRIPALLNEVHRLVEKKNLRFLLTGSSARKLRREGVNLLGGRAWEAKLFPFTWHELGGNFQLQTYLERGGLPTAYFSDYPKEELSHYIKLYLREEIQAEALVRRFDHFVRFLDMVGLTNGSEINFENIANDAGVPARTVAAYYKLLEDTLVGFEVPAFSKTKKRKAILRSKFYLFDVGVAGALTKRGDIPAQSELFGSAFEHFLIQEMRAFLAYKNIDLPLCYWRSTTQYEVDMVIGNELAIEIKATQRVGEHHLRGLHALAEERLVKKLVLVSQDPLRRVTKNIEIIPWKDFLRELWSGQLLHNAR